MRHGRMRVFAAAFTAAAALAAIGAAPALAQRNAVLILAPTVSGGTNSLEGRIRQAVAHQLGVLDRDDAIVRAPHHEHREARDHVEAVERGDLLAVSVDHRADGLEERAAAPGVPEPVERQHALERNAGSGRSEPPDRDQRQPLDPLRVVVRERHRDPAAERVPDHGHAPVAELVEQVAQDAGVPAE